MDQGSVHHSSSGNKTFYDDATIEGLLFLGSSFLLTMSLHVNLRGNSSTIGEVPPLDVALAASPLLSYLAHFYHSS
ncbi:conserved hypothetical protein [Ricinus communis]|uniref:Uncharacterized protein n=1 Tax=Ricinus communis TaxID=3988 RepID=B9RXB2_RICCO|nr:conserved hypothetical protein [Ricinus communis]